MYRSRRALDQPEVDVENQHHGEDIDRSNCSWRALGQRRVDVEN